MREIKFRVWDKKKLEWLILPDIDLRLPNCEIYLNGKSAKEWGAEIELLQYTGLKDKNGKEIYEGDVVQIYTKSGEKSYKTTVNDIRDLPIALEEGEIIGNVFENPFLCPSQACLNSIRIERVWAMPNKWTFTIKPIKKLLDEEIVGENWCDPFAGKNSPAKVTNDLNDKIPTTYHLDALIFLKKMPTNSFDGVLFDPPYSITQARQCYEGIGMDLLETKPTSMKYWGDCKTEIARITKRGGKVICFGWNSMGIGKNRDFKMTRILLVPHGGSKNDTIVTVEIKL